MRVYLVRHGETIWNIERKFQGWTDTPLSEYGEEQAGEIRDALRGIHFDAAYSSPLQRASRTAEIIVQDRNIRVTQLDDLREMGLGDLDGHTESEILEKFPGVLEAHREDPGTYRFPGGENLVDVQERCWSALLKLKEKHSDDTVLIVAHHTANKSILCRMLDIPFSRFRDLRQPPCSVSHLELRPDGINYVHAVNMGWQQKFSSWLDLDDNVRNRVTRSTAILFDMDGVILNSMPFYATAWTAALAEQGVVPGEDEIYRHEGEDSRESIRYFFRTAGKPLDNDMIEHVRSRVRTFYASFKGVGPIPGVFDIIGRVRARGIRTALVTGSHRKDIELRLSDEQKRYFDSIVTCDDVERGKPYPDPYLKALKEIGVQADDALVVENAPFGIRAAKAAGIFTIGITSTLPKEDLPEADLHIDSLKRLAGWLEI